MHVMLTVLALLAVSYTAVALQCKFCMQYEGTSDNDDVKQALDILRQVGNSNCKDNPGDRSVDNMPCPEAAGKKAVCSTASVGATYDIPNTKYSVALAMYMRACHLIDADQSVNECENLDKYADEIKQGMGPQAQYYSNMDGTFCFCEGDQCNSKHASPAPLRASSSTTRMAVLSSSLLMCVAHLLF